MLAAVALAAPGAEAGALAAEGQVGCVSRMPMDSAQEGWA